METTDAFDLNRAIVSWRQTLSGSPAVHAEDLDELESHLRDAVEELEGTGLSDEEAFLVSAHRLGPTKPIEAEFGKVNLSGVWLYRVLWMLIGVQAWALFTGASRFVGDAALLGGIAVGGNEFAPGGSEFFQAILPGGLYLLAQSLTLIGLPALTWFVLSKRTSKRGSPIQVPGLILLILGGGVAIVGFYLSRQVLLPLFFATHLQPEQFGSLAYSKSIASLVLFLIQTGVMVVITLILGMRLLGAKQPATFKSQ